MIGAREAAANIAAIPTVAYAPESAVTSGRISFTPSPKTPPTIAPMNSVGKKTPPLPPEPTVIEVATSFSASSISIVLTGSLPTSARSRASSRIPRMLSSNSASAPTSAPPTAGSSQLGAAFGSRAKRSSVQ